MQANGIHGASSSGSSLSVACPSKSRVWGCGAALPGMTSAGSATVVCGRVWSKQEAIRGEKEGWKDWEHVPQELQVKTAESTQ